MKEKNWQVFKFGGTSLADGICLERVCALIHQNSSSNLIVVVSAMAGVTDSLSKALQTKNLEPIKPFMVLYRKTIGKLINNPEVIKSLRDSFMSDISRIEQIFASLESSQLSHAEKSIIIGFGEVWSARLLVSLLAENNSQDPLKREIHELNAREIINVSHGEMGPIVDWNKSKLGFEKENNKTTGIFVIGGFLATDLDSRPTTLGRNGSDFSASIIASLSNAESVTIWTDVDGVMTGDPNQVSGAKIISQMSYDEAAELAYFGAKVIHPKMMSPLIKKNIPIFIKNTFNPNSLGTEISASSNKKQAVKGITSIDDVALVNLQGTGMIGIPGTTNRLYSCLQAAEISIILITQASSEHSICFAVKNESANLVEQVIRKEFRQEFSTGDLQNLQVQKDCNIIAVVGSGMSGTKGIAVGFFKAIFDAGVNVKAIAQGSSEQNISAVVNQKDAKNAVESVHSAFFSNSIDLIIGILGFGNVARELFNQLQQQSKAIKTDSDINIQVVALANSRRMILKGSAITVSEIDQLSEEQKSEKSDLNRIVDHLVSTKGAIKVVVDCTASEDVPNMYKLFFSSGIHVITANKKGLSGSIELYDEIMHYSKSNHKSFYYETTAGAGLPFIKSLQDLILTGDTVHEIEGIFSGTLSYLFNTYDGSIPFSKIISDAKDQGFTEPDPREDLSGMDVARKLVILAREMNLKINTDDIDLQSLVDQELDDLSVDGYLEKLKDYDSEMQNRFQQAHKKNKVLRYIARLSSSGVATIKLEEVDSDHPFAQLNGSENIIIFKTERYSDYPLVHRGSGAGPSVTAAGIFADLLMVSIQLDRLKGPNVD
ncbi:MAG: bifunctional aspartate kinase/homoserine dehydrogenase I [Gammaproteobacteria bacterium]|nr:bifunctional aspartate kinase/homoserine dehydrogenase I [Gammaproteobacteria bacterium]|tara:strand:- start:981 stop:3467 length:2487 start_codon:yes stop_codon:yes gene_type:complete